VITFTTSTAVQNLVEIRPWGASEQIGEILVILFFIPLYKQLTYRSDRSPIFTLIGSNDADSRNGVPLLALVDIAAHLGDKIAQKPQFRGVNRHFPAKRVKY